MNAHHPRPYPMPREFDRGCYLPAIALTDCDSRALTCEACGGDGGWDVESTFNPFTGNIGYRSLECRACDGFGEIEIGLEPIEMEDLDDIELGKA